MSEDSGKNDLPRTSTPDKISNIYRPSLVLGQFKGSIAKLYRALSRCKPVVSDSRTELNRVLGLRDLMSISLGASLNVEVYDLPSIVSNKYAGPAVVLSMLIGSVSTGIAGLSYAEFCARTPKAGSVYYYTYVCIGEFAAFIIGWGLTLEYIVGAASVAKSLSTYLDEMVGKVIRKYLLTKLPMHCSVLAAAPDLFASVFTLIVTFVHAFGMHASVKVNSVFTLINISVILFVIFSGITQAKSRNWRVDPKTVPAGVDAGKGGFFPYGFMGVINGSSVCFFGLNGLESVSTAGEEANYPHDDLPRAIILSLTCVILIHTSVSIVVPLMLPYYEQERMAPLPYIYKKLGWSAATFIVHVGILAALITGLVGMLFPLSRVVYAMAVDGLTFHAFGVVHKKYQTPFVATFVMGAITSLVALLVRSDKLQFMMSFGTLFAFTTVAFCVLLLRYHTPSTRLDDIACFSYTCKDYRSQIFNHIGLARPTVLTSCLVRVLVTVYCVMSFLLAGFISINIENILELKPTSMVVFLCGAGLLHAILWCIHCQPSDKTQRGFVLPLVPWLPGISIPINFYLMFTMDSINWLNLVVWYSIGVLVYIFYGFNNSVEGKKQAIRLTAYYSDPHFHNDRPRIVRINEVPETNGISTLDERYVVGTPSPILLL